MEQQKFYIITKTSYDFLFFFRTVGVLCEDGNFREPQYIMNSHALCVPVFFTSKESAKSAKKVYGHWPKYKVIEILDPSWLN